MQKDNKDNCDLNFFLELSIQPLTKKINKVILPDLFGNFKVANVNVKVPLQPTKLVWGLDECMCAVEFTLIFATSCCPAETFYVHIDLMMLCCVLMVAVDFNNVIIILICTLFFFVSIHPFKFSHKGRLLSDYVRARLQFSDRVDANDT